MKIVQKVEENAAAAAAVAFAVQGGDEDEDAEDTGLRTEDRGQRHWQQNEGAADVASEHSTRRVMQSNLVWQQNPRQICGLPAGETRRQVAKRCPGRPAWPGAACLHVNPPLPLAVASGEEDGEEGEVGRGRKVVAGSQVKFQDFTDSVR